MGNLSTFRVFVFPTPFGPLQSELREATGNLTDLLRANHATN